MKKREIKNTDLELIFNSIIEQAPLVDEKEVSEILQNHRIKRKSFSKSFFQYPLNVIIAIVGFTAIICVFTIFNKGSKEITNLDPGENKNLATEVTADTVFNKIDSLKIENISQKEAETIVIKPPDPALILTDIYKKLDKEPQLFSVNNERDTTLFCKEGTSIKIPANAFVLEKNGNNISGNVKISVNEYYQISDMLGAQLTTTSGDKVLETGGMIHISASANQKPCMLKPGYFLEIGFPTKTERDDMQMFYGEKNNNNIEWIQAQKEDNVEVEDEIVIDITPVLQIEESINEVYIIVEDMPEFPGGDRALRRFLKDNAFHPYSELKDQKEGTVYVSFIVDTLGNTKNFRVKRGINKTLDKTAVYAISKLPRWKPGKQRGRPVNVSYTVAVEFKATKGEPTETDIKKAKELERELKQFDFDIENNGYHAQNRELEKKIKNKEVTNIKHKEVERYLLSSRRLGWLNCDRYIARGYETVRITVPSENQVQVSANIVFHRFNSIVKGTKQNGKISFNQLPKNEKATIVAIRTTNNKIQLAIEEIELTKDTDVQLKYRELTLKLLRREMEKLNK